MPNNKKKLIWVLSYTENWFLRSFPIIIRTFDLFTSFTSSNEVHTLSSGFLPLSIFSMDTSAYISNGCVYYYTLVYCSSCLWAIAWLGIIFLNLSGSLIYLQFPLNIWDTWLNYNFNRWNEHSFILTNISPDEV